MKKKDILISLVIIAVLGGVVYFYTQRTGYIQVDADGINAALRLRSSLFGSATIHSGQGPEAIRARVHRPQHLRLSIEQKDHNWLILSKGPWGSLARINVRNNQTTVLRLGPPFLIKPRVRINDPVVSIEFDIVGQAGEQYETFVRKNNRTIAGASIKIIDEAGDVLESGKFRYG
jgi:hypothetical protein